jgi:uncharacterized damage-inducible protein DinB
MSASLLSTIEDFSRYNRRANRELYGACHKLSAEELALPRKAFFGSILGTLNHILVMDRIWIDRFTGTESERMEEFVDTLTIAFLATRFRWQDLDRQYHNDQADVLVLHMFNHQTHHRGQIHDMLSQTDIEPPSLDYHELHP